MPFLLENHQPFGGNSKNFPKAKQIGESFLADFFLLFTFLFATSQHSPFKRFCTYIHMSVFLIICSLLVLATVKAAKTAVDLLIIYGQIKRLFVEALAYEKGRWTSLFDSHNHTYTYTSIYFIIYICTLPHILYIYIYIDICMYDIFVCCTSAAVSGNLRKSKASAREVCRCYR